jgi:hypothetical protein
VDCDVELVEGYVEAVRHPLAKKVALTDEYDARLWSGSDPHFYMTLLWSLWNKKIACYGAPQRAPIPKSAARQQSVASEPGGFEVWVSEENLPLAKWILESVTEEFEKNPPKERTNVTVKDLSPGTMGICPLCFGEFATASSYCPNCGVPLRLSQPELAIEDSARLLCNIGHPKFITDLRKALHEARIPYNNANVSGGDFISGRYIIPNYKVAVLDEDFERATQAMVQVLQHWEFEPSAGFGFGGDSRLDYWPVRAMENGWVLEEVKELAWSGQNLVLLDVIGGALQENEIPYRMEMEQLGTAKIFCHHGDEERAREIVREVVEGAPRE